MLKLFDTKPYKDRVDIIYRQLERNPWCDLHHFERCMRRIHILNAKILNKSADLGGEEGVYNTL